jgi:hypothetical protein
VSDVEQPILVLFELLMRRPTAKRRRNVKVTHDMGGELLEILEQLGYVELPKLVGANDLVEPAELLIIERP